MIIYSNFNIYNVYQYPDVNCGSINFPLSILLVVDEIIWRKRDS